MEEGWERPARLEPTREELQHLIEPAFPGRLVGEHAVLQSGLANTNVRFRVVGDSSAYVLRLHTRDATAARRERALMRFFEEHPEPRIPVPPLLYSDPNPDRGPHPYSIWRFVHGRPLQELFAALRPAELVEIASVCGTTLAALAVHRFDRCGEFGPNLEIAREYERPSRFVPRLVHRALFEGRAGKRLGSGLRDAVWAAVERASPRLEVIDPFNALVHADYKRSNLLIERTGRSWAVSAVLDWEFAFAGPPLIDVGLFLRAGEALPGGFREAFAAGYRAAGGVLPNDWLPLSRLIDTVNQVTFLDDTRERPRVFAETTEVLKETLTLLA